MRYIVVLLTIAILLAGCTTNTPRPMKLYCGTPKGQLIEKISGFFVGRGYSITLASVEAGAVQAEDITGAGGLATDSKRQISVSVGSDTLTITLKSIAKAYNGTTVVQTWDETNAKGETLTWVQDIMNGLRSLCGHTQ